MQTKLDTQIDLKIMEYIVETLGDGNVLILTGIITGLTFGFFGQQSRFCLRSATIEFWRGRCGKHFAVWLLVFSSALLLTQLQILTGNLDPGSIRQLTNTGSLSGAIIGGLMFGAGMILSRGCASRMLILSGTGNLRAFTAGLIITLVAQASLKGILAPAREWLSFLWPISGADRNMALWLPDYGGLLLACTFSLGAIYYSHKSKLSSWIIFASLITGFTVTLGWWLTSLHSSASFEIIKIQSVTFTGPSADTLMALISQPNIPLNFGSGLVPGVFFGSMLAALVTQEFKLQKFTAETGMGRYLIGALLMGFGGMLAGGCAVGAGVTGGSIMALTAWVALFCMWLSAGVADRLFNQD